MAPWPPPCHCENFRNGLSESDVGKHACAKAEVHGLQGKQTWCQPVEGPLVMMLDDGCPSGMRRCVVTYARPDIPRCQCDEVVNGASPTSSNGLCQKTGTRTCLPRNYEGDKQIGGADHYGCPEDTFLCDPIARPDSARRRTVMRERQLDSQQTDAGEPEDDEAEPGELDRIDDSDGDELDEESILRDPSLTVR